MLGTAIRLCREIFILPFEGYHKRLPDGSCQAYPDPATKGPPWTIGYGTTGPDVRPGTVWTHDYAALRCDQHLMEFAMGLIELSPGLVDATPKQFAALLSWAYNCGLRNYRISTLRKRVDERDWDSAAREMLKWDKAAGKRMKGLTRRRQAESAMLK